MKNYYVAVRVIRVQVFGVYALNDNQVANVQGLVERVRPAVARSPVGYAHAAAFYSRQRIRCVEHCLCAVPEAENSQSNQADNDRRLEIIVFPKLLQLSGKTLMFRCPETFFAVVFGNKRNVNPIKFLFGTMRFRGNHVKVVFHRLHLFHGEPSLLEEACSLLFAEPDLQRRTHLSWLFLPIQVHQFSSWF